MLHPTTLRPVLAADNQRNGGMPLRLLLLENYQGWRRLAGRVLLALFAAVAICAIDAVGDAIR